MSVRERRIDDRDPSITYSSGWGRAGNAAREYMGTTTVATDQGATAKVRFEGTGIAVLGTVGPNSNTTVPTSRYGVDRSPSTEFRGNQLENAVQYNVQFFRATGLPYGAHELNIAHVAGLVFYDSFTIYDERDTSTPDPPSTPRPNTSSTGASSSTQAPQPEETPSNPSNDPPIPGQIRIDDRDPSVKYSGGWGRGGNAAREFRGTTSLVTSRGATAVVDFDGTGIAVLGTIGPNANNTVPATLYSVDGDVPTQFQAQQTRSAQYNQTFFSTTGLSPGSHSLEITHVSGEVFLDYFILFGQTSSGSPPRGGTVTSSSVPLPGASGGSGSGGGSGSSKDSDSGVIGDGEPTSASSSNTGAIIGGALGGAALLGLILAATFFIYKYQKRKRTPPSAMSFQRPDTLSAHQPPYNVPGSPPVPSSVSHSELPYVSNDHMVQNTGYPVTTNNYHPHPYGYGDAPAPMGQNPFSNPVPTPNYYSPNR